LRIMTFVQLPASNFCHAALPIFCCNVRMETDIC
jgi:hypothetical protein